MSGKVIVVEDENGSVGASFDGDCGEMPVAAPVVLGKFVEALPMAEFEDGDVLATFPPGEPAELELTEAVAGLEGSGQ